MCMLPVIKNCYREILLYLKRKSSARRQPGILHIHCQKEAGNICLSISLTDQIVLAVGKHAMRYALHGDVCAYYTNLEDFFSDWTSIGYTRTEARALLHGGKGEFFKLPDNLGYIRFAE